MGVRVRFFFVLLTFFIAIFCNFESCISHIIFNLSSDPIRGGGDVASLRGLSACPVHLHVSRGHFLLSVLNSLHLAFFAFYPTPTPNSLSRSVTPNCGIPDLRWPFSVLFSARCGRVGIRGGARLTIGYIGHKLTTQLVNLLAVEKGIFLFSVPHINAWRCPRSGSRQSQSVHSWAELNVMFLTLRWRCCCCCQLWFGGYLFCLYRISSKTHS